MIYSKFDLFSSQFNFNIDGQQRNKGTLFGTILTLIVGISTLSYFIYIIVQYATNQIEPAFRSQSFITNDRLDMPLANDLVGFRFEAGDGLQGNSKDKIFLVYIAYFYYSAPNINQFIQLDVVECTNPNLEGFYCLDFSKVSNYTLALSNNENIKSNIEIFTYGCLDVDSIKTTVTNNCANQTEIDNLINGFNSILRFKLLTSQYNITSQQIETSYRNAFVYTVANQAILSQLKAQQQVTSVKQGPIFQRRSTFTSPIQYTQQDQVQDKQYALQQTGTGAYSIAIIYLDEIVQQIQIQYPTLPQVLALVNSIFTLLMILGIFGRYLSQNSIKKDFFMLFFRNMYQSNYIKILQSFKLIEQLQSPQQVQQEIQVIDNQEITEVRENLPTKPLFVPELFYKQKKSLDLGFSDYTEKVKNFNNHYSKPVDFNQKIEHLCISQEIEENQNGIHSPIVFQQQNQEQMINPQRKSELNSIAEQPSNAIKQKSDAPIKSIFDTNHENNYILQNEILQIDQQRNISNLISCQSYSDKQEIAQTQNTLSPRDKEQIQQLLQFTQEHQNQQMNHESKQDSQQITEQNQQCQTEYTEKDSIIENLSNDDNIRRQIQKEKNIQIFSNKKVPSSFLKAIMKRPSIETKFSQENKKTQLNQNFYIQNMQNIYNQSMKTKIQDNLFRMSFFKKSSSEMKELNNYSLSQIEEQIAKEMNIMNIIKDIIFLKKAVIMMLTKDQLAILQLIGCSSSFLDLNLNNINLSLQQLEKEKNLSHYESQLAILQSEKFMEENVEKFLSRNQNSQFQSGLDQRIMLSLKKTYIN